MEKDKVEMILQEVNQILHEQTLCMINYFSNKLNFEDWINLNKEVKNYNLRNLEKYISNVMENK